MKSLRLAALATLFLLLTPPFAAAKWWLFGQTEAGVSTRYLYLNGISYDELGRTVTVYRDSLEEGRIVIRGKAATGNVEVGAVQVSVNGKESWEKARRSSDGTFEFGFIPETGRKYVLYVKIIDTAGKSNDVEATRKELTVSDGSIRSAVAAALEGLVSAYRAEDPAGFMRYVSDAFTGDAATLDRAVRKDFSLFDNIDLRYTLNAVTGASGKAFVAVSFNRSVVSARTGKSYADKGTTEFVFSIDSSGSAKIAGMKNPLMFGVCDADAVASGTSAGAAGGSFIAVDPSGAVVLTVPGAAAGGSPVSAAASPMALQIAVNPRSMKHHMVVLDLTAPNWHPSFDLQVEESQTPGGPWENVYAGPWPTGDQAAVMSTAIAQKPVTLYYRARIITDVMGPWSNTVPWNNR